MDALPAPVPVRDRLCRRRQRAPAVPAVDPRGRADGPARHPAGNAGLRHHHRDRDAALSRHAVLRRGHLPAAHYRSHVQHGMGRRADADLQPFGRSNQPDRQILGGRQDRHPGGADRRRRGMGHRRAVGRVHVRGGGIMAGRARAVDRADRPRHHATSHGPGGGARAHAATVRLCLGLFPHRHSHGRLRRRHERAQDPCRRRSRPLSTSSIYETPA